MITATKSVHAIVTETFVSKLAKGIVPWRYGWHEARLPFNLASKRPYSGSNILQLASEPYAIPAYLTWRQVLQLRARVRFGEKGHLVTYASPRQGDAGQETPGYSLRYYMVWNIEQCDGLPERMLPGPMASHPDGVDKCEEILYHMPRMPHIQYGGTSACYDAASDRIRLSGKDMANFTESYYASLFRPLVHSIGHERRLGRKTIMDCVDTGELPAYSLEVLIAEIGACFLRGITGIADIEMDTPTDYGQRWTKILIENPTWVVKAGWHAQASLNYILKSQR